MALHHHLKPVPARLEVGQLFHARPSHRSQQLILLLGLNEIGLNLRLLLAELLVGGGHLAHLFHGLGANSERFLGTDEESINYLQGIYLLLLLILIKQTLHYLKEKQTCTIYASTYHCNIYKIVILCWKKFSNVYTVSGLRSKGPNFLFFHCLRKKMALEIFLVNKNYN